MVQASRRIAVALALFAALPMATAQGTWRGYDEGADAQAAIAQAVQRVQGGSRKVLVVFGANWCGDCRVLDETMKTGHLKQRVDAHFEVVKVDVGRFDRNVLIAERYAVPLKMGIPTIAVVDGSGRATFVTQAGELADARAMGEAGLVRFFERTW